MMTPSAFQQWCRTLAQARATCDFLAAIRTSQPIRRVTSRAYNVSGAHPSSKMGVTIQFESHTVELWAILVMERGVEGLAAACSLHEGQDTLTLDWRQDHTPPVDTYRQMALDATEGEQKVIQAEPGEASAQETPRRRRKKTGDPVVEDPAPEVKVPSRDSGEASSGLMDADDAVSSTKPKRTRRVGE